MRHIVDRDVEIHALPAEAENLVQWRPAIAVLCFDLPTIGGIPDPEDAEPRPLSCANIPGQGPVRHEAAEPDIGKPEPPVRLDLERCVCRGRSPSVRRVTDPNAGEEPFHRKADRDERPAQKAPCSKQ